MTEQTLWFVSSTNIKTYVFYVHLVDTFTFTTTIMFCKKNIRFGHLNECFLIFNLKKESQRKNKLNINSVFYIFRYFNVVAKMCYSYKLSRWSKWSIEILANIKQVSQKGMMWPELIEREWCNTVTIIAQLRNIALFIFFGMPAIGKI